MRSTPTIVAFDDGDLVHGKVVKIDSDEVLLDIGYKSEGVIPSQGAVDPQRRRPARGRVARRGARSPRPPEGGQGRPPDPVEEARPVRARVGHDRGRRRRADEVVSGPVIEVVKGGLIIDIGLRGFLPASLVDLRRVRDLHPFVGQVLDCKIIELDKNRNNVVLSRRGVPRRDPARAARRVPHQPEAGRGPQGRRCRRSSTSVRSSTSAAWTASSTCPSCRGSTSTTRRRSSRSATRSPCRCSTSTSRASGSRCR